MWSARPKRHSHSIIAVVCERWGEWRHLPRHYRASMQRLRLAIL